MLTISKVKGTIQKVEGNTPHTYIQLARRGKVWRRLPQTHRRDCSESDRPGNFLSGTGS